MKNFLVVINTSSNILLCTRFYLLVILISNKTTFKMALEVVPSHDRCSVTIIDGDNVLPNIRD